MSQKRDMGHPFLFLDFEGSILGFPWGSGLCALRDPTLSTPANKKPFVGDPGFAMKLRRMGDEVVFEESCQIKIA
jgi:hypothetical protein